LESREETLDAESQASILELALSRGLIKPSDLEVADGDEPLNQLIQSGALTQQAVDAMAFELRQRSCESDAGSDPDAVQTQMWDSTPSIVQYEAKAGGWDSMDSTPSHPSMPSDRFGKGTVWGRYTLGKRLGSGGMGVVFEAHDDTLDRTIALKFLKSGDVDFLLRFFREAKAQARLHHDNICDVYEAGELDGQPFIAMRYVDGEELTTAASRMSMEAKVKIVREVADAIHAAHREGLIHRDIKPSNIMIEERPDGSYRPTVLDFGLARIEGDPGATATGVMLGTPAYMAPEQALGESNRIDRRTDVYALGAVLYTLITGDPPFQVKTQAQHLIAIIQSEPPRPRKKVASLPVELEAIALKCLEKENQDRYPSARALAEDLQRYLDGMPVEARSAGLLYRASKIARRHRALVAISTLAMALALVLVGTSVNSRIRASQQAQVAQRFGQDSRDIEWAMRVAHMCPLHDIREDKQAVRQRMAAIDSQMEDLGLHSHGPGHYALGRGHMALGETREARGELEQAWAHGYREPEVAYALGLTMGQQYRQELKAIDAIADEEMRTRRRMAAETEYRDPALGYLRTGKGSEAVRNQYLEGLIALYEKRYEDGLDKAAAAAQRADWFYEAKLLTGDLYLDRADSTVQEADRPAMYQDLDLARQAYGEAIAIGQSDPAGYQGLCQSWLTQMGRDLYTVDDLTPQVMEAVDACGEGVAVEPDRGTLHRMTSRIWYQYANWKVERGLDASREMAAALASGLRAIRLDPQDDYAYEMLGQIYLEAATVEVIHGRDPELFLSRAVRALERAVELAPTHAVALGCLGEAHRVRVHYQWERALDPTESLKAAIDAYERAIEIRPTPDLWSHLGNIHLDRVQVINEARGDSAPDMERAIACYREAIRLDPDDYFAYGSLGTAYSVYTDMDLYADRNPAEHVQAAAEALERAAEIAPTWTHGYIMLGSVHMTQAEYDRGQGLDPGPAVELALDVLTGALELNPEDPETLYYLAETHLIRAEYVLWTGQSPTAELARARLYLEGSLAVDAHDPDCHFALARIEMVEARWAMREGRSPRQHFQRAEASLAHYSEVYPDLTWTWNAQAEHIRWQQEWAISRGGGDPSQLQEAIALTHKPADDDPEKTVSMATRGALLWMLADLDPDPAQEGELRQQARQLLETVAADDPFLVKDMDLPHPAPAP